MTRQLKSLEQIRREREEVYARMNYVNIKVSPGVRDAVKVLAAQRRQTIGQVIASLLAREAEKTEK